MGWVGTTLPPHFPRCPMLAIQAALAADSSMEAAGAEYETGAGAAAGASTGAGAGARSVCEELMDTGGDEFARLPEGAQHERAAREGCEEERRTHRAQAVAEARGQVRSVYHEARRRLTAAPHQRSTAPRAYADGYAAAWHQLARALHESGRRG